MGKLFFDIAKYFATIVGGTFLVKPEVVTPALGIKTGILVLLVLLIGWFMYPKGGKEK